MIRTGQYVNLTAEGRTVEAMVVFASGNGRSLMLRYHAIIYGQPGNAAVLQLDDGSWQMVLGGQKVRVQEIKHDR